MNSLWTAINIQSPDIFLPSSEFWAFNVGFRSDSDVERERDVESNRSYNYDDVDEMTEAQPLTPQGSVVRAAKDQDLQHGVDKPSDGKFSSSVNHNFNTLNSPGWLPAVCLWTDGVTYEVEDSQENYDDIDASPENAKTTAELHDGPKPAPDGDEEGPKDQKDEEYPVPGQDGWAWTGSKFKSNKILGQRQNEWSQKPVFSLTWKLIIMQKVNVVKLNAFLARIIDKLKLLCLQIIYIIPEVAKLTLELYLL